MDRDLETIDVGLRKGRIIIEWKTIRIKPEKRGLYLEKDAEIWTPALSREEGFLGKEVWLGEDEIVLVIRWRGRREWKGGPGERLEGLERRFREEVPDGWEMAGTRVYEVA